MAGTGPKERALATILLQGLRYALGRGREWSQNIADSDFGEETKTVLKIEDETARQQLRTETCEFKEYCPRVFEDMRREGKLDAKSARFRQSLCSEDSTLLPLGPLGRSGSILFMTGDKRFIVKTIHRSEGRFLLNILKSYHKHILKQPTSLIVRLYGQWRLHIRVRGQVFKLRFLAMNSIFAPSPRAISTTYDLKGSFVNRRAREDDSVKKDQNLIDGGIYFGVPHAIREQLLGQLSIDSKFLCSLGIMDYSLLIGVVEGHLDSYGYGPSQNQYTFGNVAGAGADNDSSSMHAPSALRPRPVTVAMAQSNSGRSRSLHLNGDDDDDSNRDQRASSSANAGNNTELELNVIRSVTTTSQTSTVVPERWRDREDKEDKDEGKSVTIRDISLKVKGDDTGAGTGSTASSSLAAGLVTISEDGEREGDGSGVVENMMIPSTSQVSTTSSAPSISISRYKRRATGSESTYLLGIIDFLTPYRAQQVSARYAKGILLCQKFDGISTAPPVFYRERFLAAMEEYFVDIGDYGGKS